MNHSLAARVHALNGHQRRALTALAAGAQLVRRFGKFEIYEERDGKVGPAGIVLTTAQLDHLAEALGGRLTLQAEPGPGQAGGFFWVQSAHRGDLADALTMSMRTLHLHEDDSQRERHAHGDGECGGCGSKAGRRHGTCPSCTPEEEPRARQREAST